MTCTECNKRFTPKHTGQKVCSCTCLLLVWAKTPRKSKANARRLARTVGLRSLGEASFAADLEKRKVKYDYEPDAFQYVPPPRKYIPDFRIKKKKRSGGYMYIEYKGNFTGPDRTKMLLVKKQHPDLDIRLVFGRATNKLNRASKTTYAMWADKYGFPWSEKVIPEEWRKE